MNLRDRLQVLTWIAAKVSLAEVEAVDRFGLVDNERFSPDAVRAYRLLWRWSAFRFSDAAQARFQARCGRAALERRFERCRALLARQR